MINKNQFTSDGLVVKTVRTHEELRPHAEAWNDLAFNAPYRLPDSSHAWTASYLEHQLEIGESWFCLFAYEQSSLVGVLPVIITPFKRTGRPYHKFRTPYNNQTASVDFLIKPGLEKKVIPLFLDRLRQIEPACFSFEMRRLPEGSPVLEIMGKGLKGFFPVSVFAGQGSFIQVKGSFERYKARLRPKFKRNLRRQAQKIASLPGLSVSYLTGKAIASEELDRFMQVEASSWKGKVGSAINQDVSLISFYKTLTSRLRALGRLEWHFLEAESKTIAATLAIRVNRSIVLLKTCYDEAYSAYSPGTYLFEKIFEQVFQSGEVDELNFLTDYSWNRNWQVIKRSYYDLFLYPSKPLSILAGFLPLKIRLGLHQWPALRRVYRFFRTHLVGAGQK